MGICGVGIFAWLLVQPGKSHARRALGMVADYGLLAAAMNGITQHGGFRTGGGRCVADPGQRACGGVAGRA